MYETVCDTCEDKILVPFKPDPKRPAFCKECLKDYQRSMARLRYDKKEDFQPERIIKVYKKEVFSEDETNKKSNNSSKDIKVEDVKEIHEIIMEDRYGEQIHLSKKKNVW
jgi:CxxC-x17-CxxC domain-containing protein